MTFKQRAGVNRNYADFYTGRIITQREMAKRIINNYIGMSNLAPLIPISRYDINKAISKSDFHLDSFNQLLTKLSGFALHNRMGYGRDDIYYYVGHPVSDLILRKTKVDNFSMEDMMDIIREAMLMIGGY